MSNGDKWAPRINQEIRLESLEQLLADGRAAIEAKIERALILDALGRDAEAQRAFVDILLEAPTHFTALNEFGNCLAAKGHIAAACRVYAEAIAYHPENATARVNLANLLLHAGELSRARDHYEMALRLKPGHPQAHQGLGAVLAGLGDFGAARPHFQKGFANHAVSSLAYRGTKPPIRLLVLVSSGGGNIPTGPFLDDKVFMTSVIVADFLDFSAVLPAHQLIFNTIGDADLCVPALRVARRLARGANVPVINNPAAVLKTGRMSNALRFRGLPGVITPRIVGFSREVLAAPNAPAAIRASGFSFPLLLRTPGFHTGQNFVLVEAPDDLAPAVESLPGEDLLVIEFLDARGPDGHVRKYRAMIVDGTIFPLHLAISRQWKVHYFTADLNGRESQQQEEAAFLDNMPAAIGVKAVTALERIAKGLALGYGGIDFGLNNAGDVLLFEANATMVVKSPDAKKGWDYRCAAIAKILDAVRAMIVRKAGSPMRLDADLFPRVDKIPA